MNELSVKQREIVSAAKKLISSKGYAETTMRNLANELQIKAASIYSHFSSKEAILLDICERTFKKMVAIRKEIEEMDDNPEERFSRYIFLHLQSLYEDYESYDIYYKYHLAIEHLVQRKYGMLNYEYFTFVSKLVKGVLPNEVELNSFIPHATVLFVLDALSSVPQFINPENPDIEGVAKDLTYRLIYGYHKG